MAAKKATIRKKREGQYHHGELKLALKNAALRLVQEKGPRGFSINEASRLAGVTVAAPYRHFADKEALLAEIARDGFDLLAAQIRHAAERAEAWSEQMLDAGMAYLLFARQHAGYFAVMFSAGITKGNYPELEEASEAAFRVLLGIAARAERTPGEAMQRSLASWALVHGFATLSANDSLSPEWVREDFAALRPLLWQTISLPFSPGT